jgi:hypothetical protein
MPASAIATNDTFLQPTPRSAAVTGEALGARVAARRPWRYFVHSSARLLLGVKCGLRVVVMMAIVMECREVTQDPKWLRRWVAALPT